MGRNYYSKDVENAPELIELCLKCKRTGCKGMCVKYSQVRAKIFERANLRSGRAGQKFNYQGEILTYSQLANRLGMSPDTLRSRVKRGMTIEEAVAMGVPDGKPVKRRPALKLPVIRGERLPASQWAEKLGVSRWIFYKYLREGHTLAQAVEHFWTETEAMK